MSRLPTQYVLLKTFGFAIASFKHVICEINIPAADTRDNELVDEDSEGGADISRGQNE